MMRRNNKLLLGFLLAMIVLLEVHPGALSAQGENLLRDPGFEDTAMRVVGQDEGSGTTFSVNASWNGWYTTQPHTENWQNLLPNGTGRNNVGFGFVRSGNRSMELSRGYATFTAAIYQTVSVPIGATVRGSAYYVMDLSEGASSQARVGIDPNGGTNPYDSDIVWSAWGGNQLASSGFRQLSASTISTASAVTIFLFATQRTPTAQNGIFWDDTELVISAAPGSGQATLASQATPAPQATPASQATSIPATRVPITPQAPNPDGSIVHQVSVGETTSAIAQAYGVSVETILDLNPSLGDGRLILPGQLINIRFAPGAEPIRPATLPPVTVTPDATAVVAFIPTQSDSDQICVRVYEDRNKNGLRDTDEYDIAGGRILLEQGSTPAGAYLTDGNPEAFCFTGLERIEYTLVASPPSGYALTNAARRLVNLQAGGMISVSFGVSASDSAPTAPPALAEQTADSASGSSGLQPFGLWIAALAGGTLLLGVGITFWMRSRYR